MTATGRQTGRLRTGKWNSGGASTRSLTNLPVLNFPVFSFVRNSWTVTSVVAFSEKCLFYRGFRVPSSGSSIVEQLHQLIHLAGCLIHRALYDSLAIAGQPPAFDCPGDHFVRQLFPGCHDKIVRPQLQLLHQVGDWLRSTAAFFVVCHIRNLSDRQPG